MIVAREKRPNGMNPFEAFSSFNERSLISKVNISPGNVSLVDTCTMRFGIKGTLLF